MLSILICSEGYMTNPHLVACTVTVRFQVGWLDSKIIIEIWDSVYPPVAGFMIVLLLFFANVDQAARLDVEGTLLFSICVTGI